jgi:hypothetical protein
LNFPIGRTLQVLVDREGRCRPHPVTKPDGRVNDQHVGRLIALGYLEGVPGAYVVTDTGHAALATFRGRL